VGSIDWEGDTLGSAFGAVEKVGIAVGLREGA
jgi:hypothetical protein